MKSLTAIQNFGDPPLHNLLAPVRQRADFEMAAMHRTFDIVLGIVGLVVALAVVGAGIFYTLKKSDSPAKMFFKLAFTAPFVIGCLWLASKMGPFGPFLIVFMAVVLSFMWTPHIAEFISSPLTNLFDGGQEPPDLKPFYSIAMTKRNRGKPREAIVEIRRQLEKFPNDLEGVLLLARVQAEDLNDLAGAENTLNHFCDWPGAPEKQVAAAYTQLADWHMKNADVNSARTALEKIVARFPETETALLAEQRIAHLTEAEKVVLARHDRQDVAVPEGAHNIGLLDSTDFLKPQEIEPGKLAAAHVKHLEKHPHDIEVREKLAIIYAKDFKRLDLATMELAHLIEEPKHKPKQTAHWLNLLANFQIELGADIETVRETLGKIVERFPDLPVADLAQRRIARLENEFKGMKSSASVKLGTYEQNIGLKYGKPRKL
jgi:tetratricopeptide (TPR) repeat protein